MDAGDYARLWSFSTHTALVKRVEDDFPTLTQVQQDEILLDIVNRLAFALWLAGHAQRRRSGG